MDTSLEEENWTDQLRQLQKRFRHGRKVEVENENCPRFCIARCSGYVKNENFHFQMEWEE